MSSKTCLTQDVTVEVLATAAGGGVEGVADMAGADGHVLGHVCLCPVQGGVIQGLWKNRIIYILVEAKTLWGLGMPLFLPNCCLVLLSTTITEGFSLDHRLVWLGYYYYHAKVK